MVMMTDEETIKKLKAELVSKNKELDRIKGLYMRRRNEPMGITDKFKGCKFHKPSYDFHLKEINNPVICNGDCDCSNCGWNPEVALERKRTFDINKHRPAEVVKGVFK